MSLRKLSFMAVRGAAYLRESRRFIPSEIHTIFLQISNLIRVTLKLLYYGLILQSGLSLAIYATCERPDRQRVGLGISGDVAASPDLRTYELLRFVGNNSRELDGVPAACGLCLYLLLPLIFFITNMRYKAEIIASQSTGLLAFMSHSENGTRELKARVQNCIDRVHCSIVIYSQMMIDFGSLQGHHNGLSDFPNNAEGCARPQSKRQSYSSTAFASAGLDSTDGSMRLQLAMAHANQEDFEEAREIIDNAEKLCIYLKRLGRDISGPDQRELMSPIWPANRNRGWRQLMLKVWFSMSLFALVAYWFIGTTSTLLMIFAAETNVRSNSRIPLEWRKFTWLDIVVSILQILFVWQTGDWLLEPYSFLLVVCLDQYKHLLSLIGRLVELNLRVIALNQLDGDISQQSSRSRLSAKQVQDCDLESLNLFVMFQMYITESRIMFRRLEQCAILLYLNVFAIMVLFVALGVHLTDTWIPKFCAVSAMVILNLSLYPCAMLTKSSIGASKLVWSLIAHSESLNRSRFFKTIEVKMVNDSPDIVHKLIRRHEKSQKSINLAENSNRQLSPHIIHMWRRFVADSESLSADLSCSLLGLAKLDYSTLMRMNFWVATVVVILFTD